MQVDRAIEVGKKLLRQKHTFMLTSSPGVGKSDGVKQMVVELDEEDRAAGLPGWDLILMHPVTASPTDFKGQPWAGTDKNGMVIAEWLPYGDLRKLINADKPTACFIDDVGNDVPGAVQSSIAQLLLARCIGEHKVSEHVRFVLATNRRQDKAGVVGFRSHFLDRVATVLPIEFSSDAWIDWAGRNNIPVELMLFCKMKPDLFGEFNPSANLEKCGTPRSWAGVGRLLNDGLDDPEIIVGAVGKGNATEFLAFRDVYLSLPNVTDVILNAATASIPDKPDVKFALMGALSVEATGKNMEAILTYVDRIPQREFTALALKLINNRANLTKQGKADFKGAVTAMNSKAFTTWASQTKNKKLLGQLSK